MDAVIHALRRSLEGDQLTGAYLFTGPAGTGKTTLAYAFAEAAACLNPRHNPYDSCGECDSCRRSISGLHPEITLISPAGDQTQIWQFWDRENKPSGVLQNTLPHHPVIGRKRVYIVEKAETLTPGAANSLLKVLEEPPPYAFFILLATHPARMLPTILSRSMIVRLHPCEDQILTDYLVNQKGVSEGRAKVCTALSEGKTGFAIRLIQHSTLEKELESSAELGMALCSGRPLQALKLAEDMRKIASSIKLADQASETAQGNDDEEGTSKEKAGRTQLAMLIELTADFYRDILVSKLQKENASLMFLDYQDRIQSLSSSIDASQCFNALDYLIKARRNLDQNVSIPLLTDWLAISLVNLN
jgi:DNA polymerase-3 subunit delta'